MTTDPVFGEMAYAGALTRAGDVLRVVPRDGLRARFHVVRDDQRLHVRLDHDGFAAGQPVIVSDALDCLQFVLENRTGGAHETGLAIAGLPGGRYRVTIDGRPVATVSGGRAETVVPLVVPAAPSARVAIVRFN